MRSESADIDRIRVICRRGSLQQIADRGRQNLGGLHRSKPGERLLVFAIDRGSPVVRYVWIHRHAPPLRDPLVHHRNPGRQQVSHVARDPNGRVDQLFLLLREQEAVVHQTIERLKIATQLLDVGFQRLQYGALDAGFPELCQKLVEGIDLDGDAARPLILLGLARRGEKGWSRGCDSLRVPR